MNSYMSRLQPSPFVRLRELYTGITPNPAYRHINLGLGEPQHPTPELIKDAIISHLDGISHYPAMVGLPALREAFAGWTQRRYGVTLNPATQALPVSGSKEALFSLVHFLTDTTVPDATVVFPNPFFQVYESAAALAGVNMHFVYGEENNHFLVDWDKVPASVWQKTQVLIVCSPDNPTGAVIPLEQWKQLFELSDRYGFTIISDECYSEIWFGDTAPLGALEAAAQLGRTDFRRLVAVTSLSKRSNAPGLRSGFVSGDEQIIKPYLTYRLHQGMMMGLTVQHASIAAWSDEAHVNANRELYRQKFAQVVPVLQKVLEVPMPDASFYLWPKVPGSDAEFARDLMAQYNITVMPGSYMARDMNGFNPGTSRLRLALVADVEECLEAAHRIAEFAAKRKP